MTRDEAADYYKAVSRFILPHLRNRPLSFKRYIDHIGGEFFWEKDAPSFTPDWVRRVRVPRRGAGEDDIEYIVVNDRRTLLWLAGIGGIELHPFLHVAPRIDLATQLVFDLDPGEGADILDCARVALLLREALKAIGLESFAKVSGSKGIQVYVPIAPTAHAFTEPASRLIADELARRHPDLVVSKMSKLLRRNKVFIDWSQNADYKTTVSVYSLRATSYVSMPVRWAELQKPKKSALYFDAGQAVARAKKLGDLFEPVLKVKQKLPGAPLEHGHAGHRSKRGGASRRTPDRLPKPSSQSGRRLFMVVKNGRRTELWLDAGGTLKRWILSAKNARYAGELPIDPAYYRPEVPDVELEDRGAYEIIEGSYRSHRLRLWFSGKRMRGEWLLERGEAAESWRLAAVSGVR
jgi:bifunctional non-homologous end joining protein LigD